MSARKKIILRKFKGFTDTANNIGGTKMSNGDLAKLWTQIVALLKSRPITYVSNDTNESLALTPGHFRIGKSITVPPEPTTIERKQKARSARH